jgi:Flp pilus assembly protein TadG
MMIETTPMESIGERSLRNERGQILVIFALAVTAVIAMVGLVLDGSSAFSQRRFEQNAADLAALAGANAYMNTDSDVAARSAAAVAAARAYGTENGYTDGVAGTSLDVSIELRSSGANVKVDITDDHANSFARIVPGQESWNVSVTATAWAGVIDTAVAAGPWTMHIDAFNADGTPKYTISNPQNFGTECSDYPVNGLDMSWTDFNGYDNVNSAEVKRILDGTNVVTATFDMSEGGQYLGQHNNGCHTTLWSDTQAALAGRDIPIPIVGPPTAPETTCKDTTYDGGCFKGWAMFHVISATGGSDKVIRGYFLENFRSAPLTVGECTPAQQAAGTCGVIVDNAAFESYWIVLKD